MYYIYLYIYTLLHSIIVPHYLTLFSAIYFSMYLNILSYYYVLLPLLLTIVMYYSILQAMYGPSLINYCLLSIVTLVMPSEILGFCSSLVYMKVGQHLLEIEASLVVFSTLK